MLARGSGWAGFVDGSRALGGGWGRLCVVVSWGGWRYLCSGGGWWFLGVVFAWRARGSVGAGFGGHVNGLGWWFGEACWRGRVVWAGAGGRWVLAWVGPVVLGVDVHLTSV